MNRRVIPIYRGDLRAYKEYTPENGFDAVGIWWGGLLLKRLGDETAPPSAKARREIEHNIGGFATAIAAISARNYAMDGRAVIIRGQLIDPRLGETFIASGMSSERIHDLLPLGSTSYVRAGGVVDVREGDQTRFQRIWPPWQA